MSYEDLLGGGAQTPEPETGKAQEKKQPHVKVTDLFEISNQTALKVAKDPKLFCDYLPIRPLRREQCAPAACTEAGRNDDRRL